MTFLRRLFRRRRMLDHVARYMCSRSEVSK